MKIIIAILPFLINIQVLFSQKNSREINWKKIDEGLFYTEFISPLKAICGDQKISILKINPELYKFNLLNAKELNEKNKTAEEWAIQKNQIAVINAGMYQSDHSTNVGYMKNYNFINNQRLSKDNTIVAFNRKDKKLPDFQIIDLKCQDWNILKNKYHSFSQSIRMVDCSQKNKWSQQPKKWSMVVVGKDKLGNVLFIFSRSPFSVHDFISILLKAPIQIYNMMYLEGGPEASFYLNHNETKVAKMGSYETGFYESDDNTVFWNIPNVIGISKKGTN